MTSSRIAFRRIGASAVSSSSSGIVLGAINWRRLTCNRREHRHQVGEETAVRTGPTSFPAVSDEHEEEDAGIG